MYSLAAVLLMLLRAMFSEWHQHYTVYKDAPITSPIVYEMYMYSLVLNASSIVTMSVIVCDNIGARSILLGITREIK